MSENEIRGYADAFDEYWNKGWKSVLWLPKGKKFPPPSGYTGYDAAIPSYPDVMAWAEDHPDANLGLRFPAEIVGLDVDAYGEKTGASTIAEAMKRYGLLPPTVRSTSRTDSTSGIRLYRKPADIPLHTQIKFPGLTIGNVEVVQDHHRYCVSWPSIHPEGRMYEWRDEKGNVVPVPSIDDLPELPRPWIEGLRKESHAEITAHRDPFEALRQLPQGKMSEKVGEALRRAKTELDCEPGSRHDVANVNVLRLLRLAEKGERGVTEALESLRSQFVEMTRDRNTEFEANAEFDRMVYGQRGHDLLASTPSKENDYAVLGVADNVRQSETLAKQRAQAQPDPVVEWQPPPSDPADPVAAFLFQEEPMTGQPSQPAAGVSAADAFLFGMAPGPVAQVEQMTGAAAVAEIESGGEATMRSKLLTVAGLANVPPSEPLIDGLLYRGTLAQLSGPPGSGKTFVALGMACALASNRTDWNGQDIPWKRNGNSGSVLYVAAEGVSGLYARINAWCSLQGTGIDPRSLQLYVYPEAVQLGSYTQMEELTELARSLDCVLRKAELPALPAQRGRIPRRAVQYRELRAADPFLRGPARTEGRRIHLDRRRRPPVFEPRRAGDRTTVAHAHGLSVAGAESPRLDLRVHRRRRHIPRLPAAPGHQGPRGRVKEVRLWPTTGQKTLTPRSTGISTGSTGSSRARRSPLRPST
ncbi:primase/polymerase [Rhodococcus phage REQ1]|uniref:DNA polymerase/primase n=1 Tax=Rhodococcus phage REQ1 TaxID=1109712 RepID=UPI00023EEC5F|nr:DNA polymerase/primase [Rhodococcus phage REQ1]AEV52057.1 primase/polymerase [Rhodococcus phage REQ1]